MSDNILVIYTEQQRRDMSLKHKTKGNEHFKNKKFHLAIEEYTKAIVIFIFFLVNS